MPLLRLPLFVAIFTFALAVGLAACGSDDGEVDAGAGDGDGTRPSLAGDWLLTSATIAGADTELPAGRDLDLTIEAGRISGNGGCNSFGGTIDAGDDGSLTLSDLAITEMGCEPFSINEFETSYVQALIGADEWDVTPTALIFRGEGTELVYEAGAPAVDLPLEQTAWTFDTIFEGSGVERAASTPRMDRPEVIMTIQGGQISLVSDDCGEVIIEAGFEEGVDGNLSIADPEGLVVDCPDADSNMTAAVSGIVDATGFQIAESRLTFIGFDGETVGFRGAP